MEFKVFNLGLVDFKQAWEFQKQIFLEVKNGLPQSGLILCRHFPVITLGRASGKENILTSAKELHRRTISLYSIERGGDVTYHGPGQITAYPIFNLKHLKKDLHWFLRCLEEVAIDLFRDFGIKGLRRAGLTGVWIEQEKIASIGITVKNWITFHGLSINVKKSDLDNFRFIKPCGMDIRMTSLETVLNRSIEIDRVKENLISKFRGVFKSG